MNKKIERAYKFVKTCNPFAVENTRYLKLIVSTYPGVAAVWLAFFKDPIVASTSNAARYFQGTHPGDHYTINWMTLIYWVLLLCWIYCYFNFVSNESATNKRTTDVLKSAIFRSPNPQVYTEYRIFYKRIMERINKIDGTIESQNINLKLILENICQLTQSYINQIDDRIIYGANIMLYIPYQEPEKKLVQKLKENKDEWFQLNGSDINSFVGVLRLVPELSFKNEDKTEITSDEAKKNEGEQGKDGVVEIKKKEGLLPITLPIIYADDFDTRIESNIPGAPLAALSEYFMFSSVRDKDAYVHLGVPENKIAKEYWEKKMPHIGSIFSLAVPCKGACDKLNIVAVLNIDSTKPDILGTDREYHYTFISLMYPILCQLGPHLMNYYKLYLPELKRNLKV